MTLASGDLTTPQRAANWIANPPNLPSAVLNQIITSMSRMIYSRLSRSAFISQNYTRTGDGVGGSQLILPDYPVTTITSIQVGPQLIQPYPLPNPVTGVQTNTFGYGYRYLPWSDFMPGEPCIVEFVNGYFPQGFQNIVINYTAGYLVSGEVHTVPAAGGYVTANQPNGICSLDAGVTYTASGLALTPMPVGTSLTAGQYIAPVDAIPGVYTFAAADASKLVTLNYSFLPADIEEACIQMVAERMAYRSRVGVISQSLGGQETMRFLRGGDSSTRSYEPLSDLPPEVRSLLTPYVNVVPPWMGAAL